MTSMRVFLFLLLASLAGCGDGSDGSPEIIADPLAPRVLIDGDGDIEVQVGGRTLFAMPGDQAP